MAFQSVWVVANVMDGAGQKYNLMREYKTADTTMPLASKEVAGLKAMAEPLFDPSRMLHGRIFQEMDPDRNAIFIKPFLSDSKASSIVVRPSMCSGKMPTGVSI